MAPELGSFALIIAVALAMVQAVLPMLGIFYASRSIALGQCFFVTVSFLILGLCFITDNFSVAYVAANSNSTLPWIYKLCAIWGAHEGSLLLWVFILSIWGVVFSLNSRNIPLSVVSKVLAVMAAIACGFFLLLLKSSNPFLRLFPDFPIDGADLNPLLQDPGLVSHPPILYMGYVGFALPFSFAIVALLSGTIDKIWAQWVRPWALVAWGFLSIGIALGSWWAYYELGWGGWWFWDPVENASFMPWLVGTALLHCLLAVKSRGLFYGWMVFLCIAAFSLSLLGTFLVRSGVLSSVHSFATDPERGMIILQFLAISIGGSLLLYGLKAKSLSRPKALQAYSKATFLLVNNLLLLVATGAILLGTLYPLIYDALFNKKISVGYPYFNAVFIPIMLPMLLLMLPGMLCKWDKNKFKLDIIKIFSPIILSLLSAVLLPYLIMGNINLKVVLGLSLAFSIILAIFSGGLYNIKNRLGMSLSHIGVAVTIIGIVLVSNYQIETDVRVQPGDIIDLNDYKISLDEISLVEGSNYIGHRGYFGIYNKNNNKLGNKISMLYPEKRLYFVQGSSLSETAILPGLFRDIYIALGEQLDVDSWSARIYYKPFVRWIWFGAFLMAMGAMVVAWKNRKYVS